MKKSRPRLSLAVLLAATLALTPWGAGTAAAGGEPPASEAPGSAWQAGVERIGGWLGNLLEPWIGGADKDGQGQGMPGDKDGVNGPVGSGIDPSGFTGHERPHNPPPSKGH